jgi:hypothetical protein
MCKMHQRKTEVHRKPATLPLCSQEIPYRKCLEYNVNFMSVFNYVHHNFMHHVMLEEPSMPEPTSNGP